MDPTHGPDHVPKRRRLHDETSDSIQSFERRHLLSQYGDSRSTYGVSQAIPHPSLTSMAHDNLTVPYQAPATATQALASYQSNVQNTLSSQLQIVSGGPMYNNKLNNSTILDSWGPSRASPALLTGLPSSSPSWVSQSLAPNELKQNQTPLFTSTYDPQHATDSIQLSPFYQQWQDPSFRNPFYTQVLHDSSADNTAFRLAPVQQIVHEEIHETVCFGMVSKRNHVHLYHPY